MQRGLLHSVANTKVSGIRCNEGSFVCWRAICTNEHAGGL